MSLTRVATQWDIATFDSCVRACVRARARACVCVHISICVGQALRDAESLIKANKSQMLHQAEMQEVQPATAPRATGGTECRASV